MKKILAVLLLLPALIVAQTTPKSFTIKGKVEGFPDGTEVSLYRNGDNKELVKTTILKNAFSLKGNVNEPVLCFLTIGDNSKPVEVYVENAVISVTGTKAEPDKFTVSGSVSQVEFSQFINTITPVVNQLSALAGKINSVIPGAGRDSMMTQYNGVMQQVQQMITWTP